TTIVALGVFTILLFAAKGASTYGNVLVLSRITNRIVAANQRRVLKKLLNESIDFITAQHSTEYIARLAAGAGSASALLNLLITAAGRDLLSLLGLTFVMVIQDPLMSLASFVVAPPAILVMRKLIRRIHQVTQRRF